MENKLIPSKRIGHMFSFVVEWIYKRLIIFGGRIFCIKGEYVVVSEFSLPWVYIGNFSFDSM